jgi:hypothetical protein
MFDAEVQVPAFADFRTNNGRIYNVSASLTNENGTTDASAVTVVEPCS